MIHVDIGLLLGIVATLVSIGGGMVAIMAYFAEKRKHIQLEGGRVRMMEELHGKVSTLEHENTDLRQKLARHDTDLSTLEVKLENVEAKIAEVKVSVDRLGEKLDRFFERHKL